MNHCPYCKKPYAASNLFMMMPTPEWYVPPIGTTTTTNITMRFSTGTQITDCYCYGHVTALCEECGLQVPVGFHAPESCRVLRAILRGLATPECERSDEPVAVPDVFQEAFKESL